MSDGGQSSRSSNAPAPRRPPPASRRQRTTTKDTQQHNNTTTALPPTIAFIVAFGFLFKKGANLSSPQPEAADSPRLTRHFETKKKNVRASFFLIPSPEVSTSIFSAGNSRSNAQRLAKGGGRGGDQTRHASVGMHRQRSPRRPR